jgi:hypothetical protein
MADSTTTTYALTKPEVGASEDTWGTKLNTNFDALDDLLDGTTAISPNLSSLTIDGTAVTSTAAELNILDGATVTTAELNTLDGFTGTVDDLNYAKDLRATGVTADEFDKLDGLTSTAAELNLLDGSVANTVVNSKAVIYGSAGEVQATTVDLGDWTITQSGTSLKFSYDGTVMFELSSTGALSVADDVTAFGTL